MCVTGSPVIGNRSFHDGMVFEGRGFDGCSASKGSLVKLPYLCVEFCIIVAAYRQVILARKRSTNAPHDRPRPNRPLTGASIDVEAHVSRGRAPPDRQRHQHKTVKPQYSYGSAGLCRILRTVATLRVRKKAAVICTGCPGGNVVSTHGDHSWIPRHLVPLVRRARHTPVPSSPSLPSPMITLPASFWVCAATHSMIVVYSVHCSATRARHSASFDRGECFAVCLQPRSSAIRRPRLGHVTVLNLAKTRLTS